MKRFFECVVDGIRRTREVHTSGVKSVERRSGAVRSSHPCSSRTSYVYIQPWMHIHWDVSTYY